MEVSYEFANLVIETRIKKGLRQADVAEAIGCSVSTYSRFESEKFSGISFSAMIAACLYLGIFPEGTTPTTILNAINAANSGTNSDLFKLSGYQVETTADGGADLIQETTGKKVHLSAFDFGILTGKIIGSLQNIVDPYFGK